MKLLDRYIIRQFLGTFFFILLLIMSIAVVFDISELTLSDDFDFHCTLSDGAGSVDGSVPLDYRGLKCAPTDLAASYEQLQCGLSSPWFVHQPSGSSVNVIVTYEALAGTT